MLICGTLNGCKERGAIYVNAAAQTDAAVAVPNAVDAVAG
jgi:hypothetical protein